MIVISACFARETRWIAARPGVAVVHTAMGAGATRDIERRWPAGRGVDVLISTGMCGAADPTLCPGDLVLADRVFHRGEEIVISPELLHRIRHGIPGLRVGAAASCETIAGSAQKRGAGEAGALTVDMESGPLARWANEHGVDFLVIRAVLDRVDEQLPFSLDRPIWVDVVRRPIAAFRLARRSLWAGRAIGRGVDVVVAQLQRGGS